MKSKSHSIKRKIPADKLKDLQIDVDGQEHCAKGYITINGIKFTSNDESRENGYGISSFEISLPAGERPEVTVHYDPHRATKEVCEALGIEKRPSYQKGN